jgi:predicted amidophosphoribosyltransferase
VTAWWARTAADLADLVLPTCCPGCARPGSAGPCAGCRAALARLRPRRVAPRPAPAGFPACVAAGGYADPLRGCLLAFKERGRHTLAAALAELLAGAVAAAAPDGALLLVPVPATAAATRARYGDPVARLARLVAGALARSGRPAGVAPVLRARPRPDSTTLDAAGRLRAARQSFAVRPGPVERLARVTPDGVSVLLVDDVVTTGATLATVAALLRGSGVPVAAAAVVAATARTGGVAARS